MSLFLQGNIVLDRIEGALRRIGYRPEHLRRDFSYSELPIGQNTVGKIDLAAFAQTEPSYRNSCIGVVQSNGTAGPRFVAQHWALGAPLIFEIQTQVVNRWKITERGEAERKDQIPLEGIERAFEENRNEWNPDRIFSAKVLGDASVTEQLDFFDAGLLPLLEGMVFEKLDKLLRNVLSKISKAYVEATGNEPDYKNLFRLVFRFIAAKVMRDRGQPGAWHSSDALTVLRAIETYYRESPNKLRRLNITDPRILQLAWTSIANSFQSQNLSVDDLALVYESTFITPKTRKSLGTHSTPPRVAEYIVRRLPIGDLDLDDRHVLEPCSGHGGFLITAMRRLRELLPEEMTNEEQHRYLVEHLVGIEIESFALEVCWLRLVLADYPNPDGWRLIEGDVFKGNTLKRELETAQIVLCNPPFEPFEDWERKYYWNRVLPQKPAEILRRLLLNPPSMLGLVLPRIFEGGSSYRKFHRLLAETYEAIELVALPKVFNYSEAATMLVMASGRREQPSRVFVTCSRVKEGDEVNTFLYEGRPPISISAVARPVDYTSPSFSLWIPPLSHIWDFLDDYPQLRRLAEAHRGVKWKSSEDSFGKKDREVISNTPKPGYKKGFARAEDSLEQFRIIGPQYLSLREEDQYDKAFKLKWNLPKVVCNAARLRRNPWRVGAVVDPDGLAFSQRFIAFWPIRQVSLYALSALLNSPIANAYVYDKEEDRDNRVRTFLSLPIPADSHLQEGSTIDVLSRELHSLASSPLIDQDRANQLLIRLDAEILAAYGLPYNLEQDLLSTFSGYARPVPFHFSGYNAAYESARANTAREQEHREVLSQYQAFVNRMFVEELSESEQAEMERLKRLISAYNAPFYKQTIKSLSKER